MSQSRSLLLPLALGGALLVLVALASLMWFHFARPADGEPRVIAAPPPASAAPNAIGSESTAVLDTPRAPTDDTNRAALPASTSDSATRDTAEIVTGREIDGAIWIRGRVTLPPNTAPDEPIQVIAIGRKWPDRADHRARVERDGTFLSAFAKSTSTGKLKLDAPHLYLEEPVQVDLDEPPAEVELTPTLGARVRGRLVAKPGAEALAPEVVGQKVTWSTAMSMGQRAGDATIAPDLTFEFRGVPADQALDVRFHANVVEMLEQELPALTAGTDGEVELAFRAGARVRGRVVDEAGAPVRNVFVAVGSMELRGMQRDAQTDASGAFDLRGITPEIVVATAYAAGYERARVDLGELADGELREHVELILKRGNTVTGVVRWPDGSPAEGAIVRAIAEDNADAFDTGEQNARSGADGTFVLGNLPDGLLTVRAQLRTRNPKAAPDASQQSSATAKDLPRPTVIHARADGVHPGEMVELVLRAGASVTGRVLDDRGQPVTGFRVRATPDTSQGLRDARSKSFRDEAGRFKLDGLSEGRWQVQAIALHHRDSVSLPVEVRGDVALADITLMRAAIVEGKVVDSAGTPLSEVAIRVQRTKSASSVAGSIDEDSVLASDDEQTDEDGNFSLEVDPGVAFQLVASGAQRSRTTSLELLTTPGQELTGIVLTLGDSGKIVGRYIASRGESPADRKVTIELQSPDDYDKLVSTTDATGAFLFELVPAGNYQVTVDPPGPEPSWEQPVPGGFVLRDPTELRDLESQRWYLARETARVVVAAGATSEVVVGHVARAPVAVSGRVTRGGVGVPDVSVMAFAGRPALARTDGAGRYALELDQPATYTFGIACPSGTELSQEIVIPQTPTHSVDFELASGRITGRAFGATGNPLGGIEVQLVVERVARLEGLVPRSGSCSTDGDGRFVFDGLPDGTFGLVTQVSYSFGARGQTLAPARVGGLVIQGEQSIDGVELHLETAGAIDVRVLAPDGAPATDAHLVVRDARGVDIESYAQSSGERYHVSDIAPGRYSITATRGVEVSSMPAAVDVVSGRTAKTELRLVRGTVLEIVARDASGEFVASSLSVRDASGIDYSELHPSQDSDPNEFGPFARGTYIVVVEAGAKRAERRVAVSGQERILVEMRYE